MSHSVQRRDRISVKGYGFLSFAKNMGKNIGNTIYKNLSSTYSQKLLNHAIDAFKTAPEKAIHKSAQATGDLIGNILLTELQTFQKIHNKIIQRHVTNDNDKKNT